MSLHKFIAAVAGTRVTRVALLSLVLPGYSGLSLALPSDAVFAFSAPGATSLQITAGGTTTIVASQRGWYTQDGSNNSVAAGNNYIVGFCGTDGCNG